MFLASNICCVSSLATDETTLVAEAAKMEYTSSNLELAIMATPLDFYRPLA